MVYRGFQWLMTPSTRFPVAASAYSTWTVQDVTAAKDTLTRNKERLEAIQDSLEAIQDSLETAAAAAEFGLTAEEYEDSLRATLNFLF